MRSDTTPAGERDLADVWTNTRERIHALLEAGGVGVLDRAVSTVPGTTIGDTVAHLTVKARAAIDEPADLQEAPISLPQPGRSSSASSLPDLLFDMESDRALASLMITYAVMGEHDLRTALDAPGARDDIAIKIALDELSGRFSDRVESAQLPALRVTVEQWGTIAGAGRASSCVVADRFEFVRAMSGRRSEAEIRQWNWGVDPAVYLSAISEVGVLPPEIHERDPRVPAHMRDREFVL